MDPPIPANHLFGQSSQFFSWLWLLEFSGGKLSKKIDFGVWNCDQFELFLSTPPYRR
jgi:hypothetical protein